MNAVICFDSRKSREWRKIGIQLVRLVWGGDRDMDLDRLGSLNQKLDAYDAITQRKCDELLTYLSHVLKELKSIAKGIHCAELRHVREVQGRVSG